MYQTAVFTVITVITSLKYRMPSLPKLRMPSYRVGFPRFVNRIPAHSTLLFQIPGTSTTNQDFLIFSVFVQCYERAQSKPRVWLFLPHLNKQCGSSSVRVITSTQGATVPPADHCQDARP